MIYRTGEDSLEDCDPLTEVNRGYTKCSLLKLKCFNGVHTYAVALARINRCLFKPNL